MLWHNLRLLYQLDQSQHLPFHLLNPDIDNLELPFYIVLESHLLLITGHAENFCSPPKVGKDFLQELDAYYRNMFQQANNLKEKRIGSILSRDPNIYRSMRRKYHNESVEEIVKKVFEKNKIVQYKDELIQHVDPIYQDPVVSGFFNFRSHFYAPRKHFMGKLFDTYNFNIVIIWILTVLLYITLYYESLKKLLTISERFKKKKK